MPGNMQAFTLAPIYARTTGYVKAWYKDIGAHVRKGELLAVIETPELDQQLAQAKADLATAQSNAALAKVTADRYQGLIGQNAVSQQDTDNAVHAVAGEEHEVTSAQANVRRLEELQSFERIEAPFDGVITARNLDIGQLITSDRKHDHAGRRNGHGQQGGLRHLGDPDAARLHQCAADLCAGCEERSDGHADAAAVSGPQLSRQAGANVRCGRSGDANAAG